LEYIGKYEKPWKHVKNIGKNMSKISDNVVEILGKHGKVSQNIGKT